MDTSNSQFNGSTPVAKSIFWASLLGQIPGIIFLGLISWALSLIPPLAVGTLLILLFVVHFWAQIEGIKFSKMGGAKLLEFQLEFLKKAAPGMVAANLIGIATLFFLGGIGTAVVYISFLAVILWGFLMFVASVEDDDIKN
jgi:predicted neutral ceramidase superfamily lipid hydrolase